MEPFSSSFFKDFLMRYFFLSSSRLGYVFMMYFMTDMYDMPCSLLDYRRRDSNSYNRGYRLLFKGLLLHRQA